MRRLNEGRREKEGGSERLGERLGDGMMGWGVFKFVGGVIGGVLWGGMGS
jgi:hypothetical protein